MSSPSFQSRYPVPPTPEPPRQSEHLRIAVTFLITVGVFLGGIKIPLDAYFDHQRIEQEKLEQSQKKALEEAQEFYQQDDPQSCLMALSREFTQSFIAPAQKQRNQCQQSIDLDHLNRARQLASRKFYRRAIDEAKKVTQGNLADDSKSLIQQWSREILKIAERHYWSVLPGKYKLAIDYASSLRGTPIEEEAQAKIQVWEQNWQQEEERFNAATQYISQDDFDLAKIELQQIHHPYWKRESKALWQKMQSIKQPTVPAKNAQEPSSEEPTFPLAPLFWLALPISLVWFVKRRYSL